MFDEFEVKFIKVYKLLVHQLLNWIGAQKFGTGSTHT